MITEPSTESAIHVVVVVSGKPPAAGDTVIPLRVDERAVDGQAMTRGVKLEAQGAIALATTRVNECCLAEVIENRLDGCLALLESMQAKVPHASTKSGSRSASVTFTLA